MHSVSYDTIIHNSGLVFWFEFLSDTLFGGKLFGKIVNHFPCGSINLFEIIKPRTAGRYKVRIAGVLTEINENRSKIKGLDGQQHH